MGFQTSMEANDTLKSDYRCINCSVHAGYTKKLYCANCGTASQRKEMFDQNQLIKAENITKGFVYSK